jgi:aminoglycoside phosphotransferase (APT) family kinase protein
MTDSTLRAPGLRDASDPPPFDTGRLEMWMAEHIAGFAGPIAVDQFAGGQSNPTYLVESPDRRYVLRRKPPGRLLPSAHAVDREFRVIVALARALQGNASNATALDAGRRARPLAELAWRLVQRSF